METEDVLVYAYIQSAVNMKMKLLVLQFEMTGFICVCLLQMPLITQDGFNNFILSDACQKSLKSASVLSYISPLNERTAIVLLPSLLGRLAKGNSGTVGFTHVIEVLYKARFDLCGMKMLLLSKDSARELKIMCSSDIKVI